MHDSYLKRLVDSFEARTDRVAMRIVGDDSQVYTFGETLQQIRSVAFRLGQQGVEPGDRVALIGENHPCWAIAYLAILYRGAVCVPLDPQGEIGTIANFIENSEAKLAFIGGEVEEKVREIQERLVRRLPVAAWSRSVSPQSAGGAAPQLKVPSDSRASPAPADVAGTDLDTDFDDWTSTSFPESFTRELPKSAGDDTALLIYTSGTTGVPKGVPLTHGNILAELDGINEVLKLTDEEKILSLLPLFHAYLQIVNLWVATTYGCEVGYLKELSPAELGNAMKAFKPTILTTVPRLWYLFHKKIFDAVAAKPKFVRVLFRTLLAANGALRDTVGTNLGPRLFGEVHESFGGKLRIAISAGSRFDEDVATDFQKLGFTILQGYGLTETSGAATATYETDNVVGSVGKPLKGTEIRISEPDKDGMGEVLIKGAIVFGGYYKNAAATAEAFTGDGWFRSGDLGKLDEHGHLYIVGRAKDVIVLPSGKNVHPEDLEIHYLKTPLVEEMAVVGVRDESAAHAGAEKLAAVVVPDFEYLKQAKVANSREAIRYALDNLGRDLPEYQRVRHYIIRSEPLPRTGSRKIKRFELKKEIETGKANGHAKEQKQWSLTDDEQEYVAEPTAEHVISIIRSNAPEAPVVHPAMNLEIDLGLDSLARAETFAALEHAFGKEFAAEDAAQALTVRDVVELVKESSPPYEVGVAAATPLLPEEGWPKAGVVGAGGGGDSISDLGSRNADLAVAEPLLRKEGSSNWPTIIRTADDDIPELRKVLASRPLFIGFAFVVYRCFNLFCRVFMRLEVQGLENLRAMKRPFLICPNHQSYLDPFVLCSNYSFEFFKNTFHVGASEFFKTRLMGWVAQMLHVVPVDPDTQLMKAMKAGAIGLKRGRILNIYPEGERAYDGELHKFKKGAAILATELELPILPVAIDGLHKVWARRTWRIRPAKVKIRIGEPFYSTEIDAVSSTNREQTYEAVTAHLKQTIASMIDELRLPESATGTGGRRKRASSRR
jgi:long-chain acyl-CoA synthetase